MACILGRATARTSRLPRNTRASVTTAGPSMKRSAASAGLSMPVACRVATSRFTVGLGMPVIRAMSAWPSTGCSWLKQRSTEMPRSSALTVSERDSTASAASAPGRSMDRFMAIRAGILACAPPFSRRRRGPQVHALSVQGRLERGDIDCAWRHPALDGQRGCHPSGLAGDPALRDLAHEAMRIAVARDVPAAGHQPVELLRDQRPVRNRNIGELGRHRRRYAHFVRQRHAQRPLASQHRADTGQAPGMSHADLRRAQHQESLLEARCVGAEIIEMRSHGAVRAHLHCRQVVHVEGRITGLPRPHEQGDVIAPRDERPLEEAELLAAARHELRELLGLPGLELDPAVHVDAAEQPRGVHAVVHVGLFDVVDEGRAGAREQVAVTGGVHHHVRHDGHAAFLALEYDAFARHRPRQSESPPMSAGSA